MKALIVIAPAAQVVTQWEEEPPRAWLPPLITALATCDYSRPQPATVDMYYAHGLLVAGMDFVASANHDYTPDFLMQSEWGLS